MLAVYTADQQRMMEEAVSLVSAALSSNAEAAIPELRPQAFADTASLKQKAYSETAPLRLAMLESDFKN
jgi:hypothetical protein